MRSTTAQWEVERQSLLNEIEHLRHHNVSAPVRQAEVAQTEAALQALQRNIHEMMDDPNVELSRLMQENARQEKLQAYLKGLTFKA